MVRARARVVIIAACLLASCAIVLMMAGENSSVKTSLIDVEVTTKCADAAKAQQALKDSAQTNVASSAMDPVTHILTNIPGPVVKAVDGAQCLNAGCLEPGLVKHAADAIDFVNAVDQTRDNKYNDCPSLLRLVRWDASCAVAFTDSGGFITLLLAHAYDWASDAMKDLVGDGTVNPTSDQWFNAVGWKKDRWVQVPCADHIQQGDFLFIHSGGGKPGHSMVVTGFPVKAGVNDTVPAMEGAEAFLLNVIDSSPKGHGKTDTRTKFPGSCGSEGVGRGDIVIFVEKDKATKNVLGVSWVSGDSFAEIIMPSVQPFVFGRLDEKPVSA